MAFCYHEMGASWALGQRERRDPLWGGCQLLSVCRSLLPSRKCPHLVHAAWYADHELGVLPPVSVDGWEHDPSGANQNSHKGISKGVVGGGLSLPELLHRNEHHAAHSGLVPSSMSRAGAHLKEKAHSEERGQERGSWWHCWTSWIYLYAKVATFLKFPPI